MPNATKNQLTRLGLSSQQLIKFQGFEPDKIAWMLLDAGEAIGDIADDLTFTEVSEHMQNPIKYLRWVSRNWLESKHEHFEDVKDTYFIKGEMTDLGDRLARVMVPLLALAYAKDVDLLDAIQTYISETRRAIRDNSPLI